MEDDVDPPALVRRFSARVADKASSGNAATNLELVVAEEFRRTETSRREDAQWRQWFEPWRPSNTQDLIQNKEAIRLSETWERFRNRLPQEEQVKFAGRAPTFEDIIEVMSSVEDRWDKNRRHGKSGAVCRYWRRCCNTIHAHKTMISVLPEGSQYTSLFVGVLNSVVYATRNHEKISAGLAQAIAEINDLVSWCTDVRKLYDTKNIQAATMELYSCIFTFFRDVLDWYLDKSYKRLVKSFNEDLFEDFQEPLKAIRQTAAEIKERGYQLGQASEVRATRLGIERVESLLTVTVDREAARRDRDAERRMLLTQPHERGRRDEEVIKSLNALLTEHAERLLEKRNVPQLPAPESVTEAYAQPGGEQVVSKGSWGRESILEVTAELEDHFDRNQVRIKYNPTTMIMPNEISAAVRRMISSDKSNLLSVLGPDTQHTLGPTDMAKLAASVVDMADAVKYPVISYFCELGPRGSKKGDQTLQARALTALLYAMIRQALELWPIGQEVPADISAADLKSLDGSSESHAEALRILKVALRHVPRVLYCVIDGIQWLDDTSTATTMDMLLSLLKTSVEQTDGEKLILKVLLTTSGRSRCLLRNLGRSELMVVEEGKSASGLPLMIG